MVKYHFVYYVVQLAKCGVFTDNDWQFWKDTFCALSSAQHRNTYFHLCNRDFHISIINFLCLIPVMSFLGLEGYHVFITGAAGGIGGQAVKEFLGMD